MAKNSSEGNRRRQANFRKKRAAEMEQLKAAAAELSLVKKQLAELQTKKARFILYEAEITRLKAANTFLRQTIKLESVIKRFLSFSASVPLVSLLLLQVVFFILGIVIGWLAAAP